MACRAALVLGALLLAGCEQGGHIAVAGTTADLRLLVTDTGGKPACVGTVSVTPAAPDDAKPVWQVTATDLAGCASAWRYGRTTDGFTAQVSAEPLRIGQRYRVRASGGGLMANQDFQIEADGHARML